MARTDPSVAWAIQKLQDYEEIQRSGSPYKPEPYISTCCKCNQLIDAIKTRRSIRWYENRPVDDETVLRIIESVNWAPSSCNRQPAKVFVTNNPELSRRCLELCSGSSGFSDYVPLFLIFASDPRAYEMPREVMMPYIDVSLGVQNCILVAHSLGISITLLTWAQSSKQQDKQLRRLLLIPDSCQIIVNATGGYPAFGAKVPARKTIEQTIVLIK
ncbi:MAG: nitroreductase family protein [Clostridiales bacterium]|nr:nitroreductase family protein [Clostridiales bacterium]